MSCGVHGVTRGRQLQCSKEQMMLASNLMAAVWVLMLICVTGEMFKAINLIQNKVRAQQEVLGRKWCSVRSGNLEEEEVEVVVLEAEEVEMLGWMVGT